jgi:hypothetical protein
MAPSIDEIPPGQDTPGSLTPTPSLDLPELEEDLKAWYDGISPRYVDLVSDFAGQEFFLLDGEALVQRVFNDPMLDLAGSKGGIQPIPLTFCLILTSGFQMLHFIYLVERFLHNLIRRRCFFAVVFFTGKTHHDFVKCRFWESVSFE